MTDQGKLSYQDLAERLISHSLDRRGGPATETDVADWSRRLTAFGGVIALQRAGSDILPFERLGILHEALAQALGCAPCRIYLADVETGGLMALGPAGEPLSDVRWPVYEGIIGGVFTSGRPALVANVGADGAYDAAIDALGDAAPRTMICAPLLHGESVVGVLQVTDLANPPSAGDADLVAAVTPWTVALIAQGSGLLTDGGDPPRLIASAAKEDDGWRLDAILNRILQVSLDVLAADRGMVFLYDGPTDELYSRVGEGLAGRQIRMQASVGVAGAVFRSGEGVRVLDAAADPRHDRLIDRALGYRVREILAVPIPGSDGRPIGVFQALNRRRGFFSLKDERRLHGLAAQAGLAVENWRLFHEVVSVKSYYDAILQSLHNGVITTDTHGSVSFANPAAGQILRRPGESLQGRPVTSLFSGINGWVLEEIEGVSASGERRVVEGHELSLDGAGDDEWVAVNLTIEPLSSDNGTSLGLMIGLEDVTREKKFRRTMSRYVNDEMVDRLVDAEGGDLEGSIQDVSVLMSDIRNFTSMTEQLGARDTVGMLNEYFSFMEDVVSNRKGMVDKYIGDAMMALFGAPVSAGNDADNAVTAASDMLMVLGMLNTRRKQAGQQPLRIGVGIASGQVITGNIGSSKRTSFTAIGDPVNLSARLEALTKTYGVPIIACDRTRAALQGDFKTRRLDVVRARGQNRATTLYEVADQRAAELGAAFGDVLGLYEDGLTAYLSGDWERALGFYQKALAVSPADTPSSRMLTRCRRLLADPPSEWDGVWTAN